MNKTKQINRSKHLKKETLIKTERRKAREKKGKTCFKIYIYMYKKVNTTSNARNGIPNYCLCNFRSEEREVTYPAVVV